MKLKKIAMAVFFMSFSCHLLAINHRAEKIIPILKSEIDNENAAFEWELYAAQIDKETCASQNSASCWNANAEFKTNREYGFGLGQITNTARFNNFDLVKSSNRRLKDWDFNNRYDEHNQVIALLTMDKSCIIKEIENDEDKKAFMLACYNGGKGGVNSDRLICKNTKGCDPNKWFNNVELTSNKSRQKWQGYGKSAFDINRDYPKDIMFNRIRKYKVYRGN